MVTEYITLYPKASMILIALAVTFISSMVTKWVTNQEHLKSLKARQKELQKELKDCKDDCKIKELQSEMLSITGVMMKSSFKPMFITIIPFLVLFYWIRNFFGGEVPLLPGWFWWYLGTSLVSSIFFRKLLKMA